MARELMFSPERLGRRLQAWDGVDMKATSIIMGLYRGYLCYIGDNGRENGNYMDSRDYIGVA